MTARSLQRLVYNRVEAAEILCISLRHLEHKIDRGEIIAKRCGRRILITHDEICRFLDAIPKQKSSHPTTGMAARIEAKCANCGGDLMEHQKRYCSAVCRDTGANTWPNRLNMSLEDARNYYPYYQPHSYENEVGRPLSRRLINCLVRAGCLSFFDALRFSVDEWLRMENFGSRSLAELQKILAMHGKYLTGYEKPLPPYMQGKRKIPRGVIVV